MWKICHYRQNKGDNMKVIVYKCQYCIKQKELRQCVQNDKIFGWYDKKKKQNIQRNPL